MTQGVFFHLTAAQAAALMRISAGGRVAAVTGSRGAPAMLDALRRRGFLDGHSLTPLGQAAASLVAVLTRVNPSFKQPGPKAGEGAR